jgi:hypothetical protein
MSLQDSKGTLNTAAKDLFARWQDVKSVWDDAQSKEFEDHYIFQIEQDVRTAMTALDQMNGFLTKIENECE